MLKGAKVKNLKFGLEHMSILSLWAFQIILEVLSQEYREGWIWELLYADNLVLMVDSEKKSINNTKCWNGIAEVKGQRVNTRKTEVMIYKVRSWLIEDTGQWSSHHRIRPYSLDLG